MPIMVNAVMLSVITLSVVAPLRGVWFETFTFINSAVSWCVCRCNAIAKARSNPEVCVKNLLVE